MPAMWALFCAGTASRREGPDLRDSVSAPPAKMGQKALRFMDTVILGAQRESGFQRCIAELIAKMSSAPDVPFGERNPVCLRHSAPLM